MQKTRRRCWALRAARSFEANLRVFTYGILSDTIWTSVSGEDCRKDYKK